MTIQLPIHRAELEALALKSCPALDYYELRDSIDGADDAVLLSLVIDNDESIDIPLAGSFIEAVKPAYRRLLYIQIRFRLLDLSTLTVEQVVSELDAIDTQEKRVLLAWAHATKELNPSMVEEVETDRFRYTTAIGDYLQKMFVAN